MVSAGTENQKKEPTNPISKLSKQVQEDKWEIVQFQCRRKTKNHPQQRNKEPKSSTQRGPQQPSSYSLNVKLFQAHTSKFLDTQLFEYVEKSNRRLLPSIWLGLRVDGNPDLKDEIGKELSKKSASVGLRVQEGFVLDPPPTNDDDVDL
ncbi:hypothetical protein FXO38_31124 [Capsicum annuum]|uniref:Uncharacterized protein n=1 Tax=Capsicum annuum TaxID=4072 RepID=A0A2G2Y8N3_CAPAN|nr:hypothetical protein FXO38_31124 [Capsicum annuum]KAF3663273.1 hypothetical protein FXO37_12059 [Capsicum annuum]PHT66084.1 hypothetical protein T459_30509 [Capsicum annuum]